MSKSTQTNGELLRRLCQGEAVSENIVCLHTWGRYIFDHVKCSPLWDRGGGGTAMADAYLKFLNEFPVDLLHVMEAWGGRHMRDSSGRTISPHKWRTAVAIPDVRGPADVGDINGHYDSIDPSPWLQNGNFDHVRTLADKLDGKLMIFPNIGGPSGDLDSNFDTAMYDVIEHPDRARALLLGQCRGSEFAKVKAARICGAEGFIFSLGYGGAMDLISPSLTRQVNLEAWVEFFAQLRRIGIHPVGYFLGNILPYMDIIKETRPSAILIEESKKNFTLDPVAIRKQLPPDIVLFGNLDSMLLLNGTPREIEAEVRRQAAARDYGPFVFDNGSPICPGTPPDNIRAYLEAARSV